MMNSDVLAYITESKKADNIKDSTGWYSLQKDEKTPIRIDALAPSCKLPSDLKKGAAFIKNSKTYTITDISESLNPDECKVYDNGVLMTDFTYSDADKSLSYTLDKGRHNLSFVLVDEAGNLYTVQEVSFIQVGLLYCLWFRILLGFINLRNIGSMGYSKSEDIIAEP